MKVRITRLYFDGLKRHREGSVLNISDKKYMRESEIPKTSHKKVGDFIFFAPSCMEIVDAKTPLVNVPRPIPGLTTAVKIETPVETPEAPVETLAAGGESSPADQNVI